MICGRACKASGILLYHGRRVMIAHHVQLSNTMEATSVMEDKILGHEARLSRIEGILEDINNRLKEGFFSTIKEQGARLKDVEDRVSLLAENCAKERGRLEGSKATFMAIMAAISSVGGLVGALVSRLF